MSYTYLIGWTKYNIQYYGVRYAKGCHPDDLWKTYFTSSKYVKEFREKNGMFGKKHSEETKQKIRQKALERNNIKNCEIKKTYE